jgi:hypothetical protein
MSSKIEKCLCGTKPILRRESDGPVAYVCPECYYSPEHFSRDKTDARRAWNSWVRRPRNERGGY